MRRTILLLGLLGVGACDLPPGFNEANPDPRVREADTATVNAPPSTRTGTTRFSVDFVGWQFGGNFGCSTPLNPQPGDSRIGVYVSLGQAF